MEYLDVNEENNAYIALRRKNLLLNKNNKYKIINLLYYSR